MSSEKAPNKNPITLRRGHPKHPKIAQPLQHIKVPHKAAIKFGRYFIPHKKNDYKPIFLRIEGVLATAALILVLFFVATSVDKILVTVQSPQVAAVIASTIVDLANTDRTGNGLIALTVNPTLQEAAQLKANDMAAKSYFAHVSPSGDDPWHWFAQVNYSFTYAGENLAVYFSDSDAVNNAWMNSREHRANILSDNFTEIGVAVSQGIYQGQQTTFVVQEFGTPIAAENSMPVAATLTQNAPEVATAEATVGEVSAIKVEVATSTSANPSPVPKPHAPLVKSAAKSSAATATLTSMSAPVKISIIQETPTFIAVKYIGAPPPMHNNLAGTTLTTPALDPSITALKKLLTSPDTDLAFAYGIIGLIVGMALILEVVVEVRRQHPHRIARGLSLIALMVILVFVGHTLLIGKLLIV
jgi:uncharacterized protein YkwD